MLLATSAFYTNRRLQNYGYSSDTTVTAPSTPNVKVAFKPAPAVVASTTTVTSQTPSVKVAYDAPGSIVTATGNTDVQIAPQGKFVPPVGTGKGAWTTINLSRKPDTAHLDRTVTVTWPTSSATVSGNNPLVIDTASEATTFNPLKTLSVSVTPSNLGQLPDGSYKSATSVTVPIGRWV